MSVPPVHPQMNRQLRTTKESGSRPGARRPDILDGQTSWLIHWLRLKHVIKKMSFDIDLTDVYFFKCPFSLNRGRGPWRYGPFSLSGTHTDRGDHAVERRTRCTQGYTGGVHSSAPPGTPLSHLTDTSDKEGSPGRRLSRPAQKGVSEASLASDTFRTLFGYFRIPDTFFSADERFYRGFRAG